MDLSGKQKRNHRFLSNHPDDPMTATDWSITHSPTPRYWSIHFLKSLFSLILLDSRLGL